MSPFKLLETLVLQMERQGDLMAKRLAQKPRILYLADRNFLVDDPKDKTFSAIRRCPAQN